MTLNGNRTRDPLTCSALPQPTAPLRAPSKKYKNFKKANKMLGLMNVILLKINHQHVPAIRVAIFRVVITRTKVKSQFVEIAPPLKHT